MSDQPRNIEYLLRWTREKQPHLLPMVEQAIALEQGAAPFVMGFEAGRLFQLENPDAPIDDPVGAYAPENATPQAPGTPALVSRDGQRLGCGACRQLLGDVADGLPTICPRCGAPTAPPEGWTVEG